VPIRAVVFDLDDTLIASARARKRAYRSLRRFGIEPREAETSNARWWAKYYAGECTLEENRLGRWLDLGLSLELSREADVFYRAHYDDIKIRQGVRVMLSALSERDIPMVILSNSGIDYVRERLDALRIANAVAGAVDIHGTGFKPDPSAFHAALQIAGCEACEAAMVGDNLEADVEGALEAGFAHVVWLTRRRPHPDSRVFTTSSILTATEHLLCITA
jgi:putative hydrolase of the HAD superfamily